MNRVSPELCYYATDSTRLWRELEYELARALRAVNSILSAAGTLSMRMLLEDVSVDNVLVTNHRITIAPYRYLVY